MHNCHNGTAANPPLVLHSNWGVSRAVEFRVGEMTLSEYLFFMSKYFYLNSLNDFLKYYNFNNQSISEHLSETCLRMQPRLDPSTETRYTTELGSYVFQNLVLKEIIDYSAQFDRFLQITRSPPSS